MNSPLEIIAIQHAHGAAQITAIDDLLRKTTILQPASRIMGETYQQQIDALPERLRLGECAAALAQYNDKPVGAIVYSLDPAKADAVQLELIATRLKYRRRQVASRLLRLVEIEAALTTDASRLRATVPQKMQDVQSCLARSGFRFTRAINSAGAISLDYEKSIAKTIV